MTSLPTGAGLGYDGRGSEKEGVGCWALEEDSFFADEERVIREEEIEVMLQKFGGDDNDDDPIVDE